MPLHERVRYFRWGVPAVVLALVGLHQIATHVLFGHLSGFWHALSEWTVYGLTGIVVSWLALGWIAQAIARQAEDAAKLQKAYADLALLHRHLASIHEIGREAVSAVDPFQVLELAARAPVQFAGAMGSAIVTFDPEKERLQLDLTWGLSDPFVQALRRQVDVGIPSDRCRHCRSLTARVADDCPLFQGVRSQAQTDRIASVVCLPLTCGRQRLGIIAGYFAFPAGPPESQLRLLNIVATEIAGALESVRLRARQIATLATIGRAVPTGTDLDTFLAQVLEIIASGWGLESGAVLLNESNGKASSIRAQHGLGDHARLDFARRLMAEACTAGSPTFWPGEADQTTRPHDHPTPSPFASAMAVPLFAEGEMLGALFLASTRPTGLPHQKPFIMLLAHQTALAVRNAQLHLQLSHLAILEERYRLSREMHDGLAQTLSYLGWQMDHLGTLLNNGRLEALRAELDEARRMVREAYLDVREAIEGLRLAVEHAENLAATLKEYVADFAGRTGIRAEFQIHGDGPPPTPVAVLQLLRITQEALTNVRKHAGAQHVRVHLHYADGQWELSVADDGRGFAPLQAHSRHHWGLATMRERTQSLGGMLTIASGPGQGTRITASIPNARSAS